MEKSSSIVEMDTTSKPGNAYSVFDGKDPEYNFVDNIIIWASSFLLIITCPISIWFCFQIVNEYQRAVIFRLGRLKKGNPAGPGLFFINPLTDETHRVDLRTTSFDVQPQEILSKDSVTVSVDAVIYCRVSDPMAAICNIAHFSYATILLAQTTLRNILGTKNLSEILGEREQIANQMQTVIDKATDPWGIIVERVELKDVSIPKTMQRAMAAEAEAGREARAKVVAAQGEQQSARALKEAADVISEAPAALQKSKNGKKKRQVSQQNTVHIRPIPNGYTVTQNLDLSGTSQVPEHRVAYFREDHGMNSHHYQWHEMMYNINGVPRGDQYFIYMHSQMLKRYNIERMAVGWRPVVPYSNFNRPIEVGHRSNLGRTKRNYGHRYDNMTPAIRSFVEDLENYHNGGHMNIARTVLPMASAY